MVLFCEHTPFAVPELPEMAAVRKAISISHHVFEEAGRLVERLRTSRHRLRSLAGDFSFELIGSRLQVSGRIE